MRRIPDGLARNPPHPSPVLSRLTVLLNAATSYFGDAAFLRIEREMTRAHSHHPPNVGRELPNA